MATTTVDLRSAFGTNDNGVVMQRLEALKTALDTAPNTLSGFTPAMQIDGGAAAATSPMQDLSLVTKGLDALITKGVGGDVISSLKASLDAAQADLVKDFTLTSPLATGYVAYDLEAPSAR